MKNQGRESDDLEVAAVFEPTRISKQMLEQAYELVLPIQRHQRRLVTATREVNQPYINAEQIICNEEEVA